jgi:flagellin-like hook-associated protein FlgL
MIPARDGGDPAADGAARREATSGRTQADRRARARAGTAGRAAAGRMEGIAVAARAARMAGSVPAAKAGGGVPMILGDTTARIEQDSAMLRMRLQVLTRQISTGRNAEMIGDMAPTVNTAVTLRTEVSRRETYGNALVQAEQRAEASRVVLSRLLEIGREIGTGIAMQLNPDHPEQIAPIAEQAREALIEVGSLLNTRYGGEYLFAGSDTLNPPVPDPKGLPESGWATTIATAVAGLGGGTAASVAAQTLAAVQDDASGTTPFSDFVSDSTTGLIEPRRSVPSEDGAVIGYGLFANRNTVVTSIGETAGGWARDLMRGLMSLAALTTASTADRTDFQEFAATIRAGLSSATDALGDEAGALGQVQARLAATVVRHEEITVALSSQLAEIEDTDIARAVSMLQQTQTQLQASYEAMGRMLNLSLTQFLR